MRLVVDVGNSVPVRLYGEDQRGVLLADQVQPGVAAVGLVERERVLDDMVAAGDIAARRRECVGNGEEEEGGEEVGEKQRSHGACEWEAHCRDPEEGCWTAG